MIIHLVACVAKKATHATAAKDLYRSDWFLKARAYVDAQRTPWFILSALHGLVAPDAVIEPYDVALATMTRAERNAWGARVTDQLAKLVAPTAPVVILAGRRYRDPLTAWAGDRATVPMAGMGIGQQKAWLANAVASR